MKIAMRGGHSDNCGGAVGYLNEYNECQKVYKETARLLKEKGHIIVDCNSHEYSAQDDLYKGTNTANANGADLFISIHMNAGGGNGVEAWCYDPNSQAAVSYGQIICKNISTYMGIPNRGVKYNPSFHDLRCTSMQAIIVECLFVDGSGDYAAYKKYGYEKLARCIAHSIDSSIPINPSTPVSTPEKEEGCSMDTLVLYFGDADVFAALLVSQKYKAPLMSLNDFKISGLKAKKVIQIGGHPGENTRFDTFKNAAKLV